MAVRQDWDVLAPAAASRVPAHRVAAARWTQYVNGVQANSRLRDWLTDTMSLTLKLTRHSRHFRVRRLHQGNGVCLADETAAIGLPRRAMVQEREVLLQCDGVSMVYAHTIVPLTATAADWPFFRRLGERSLGSTLFYDPRVRRGQLEYARLRASHPLARRARAALARWTDDAAAEQKAVRRSGGTALPPMSVPYPHLPLFARRCAYRRRRGVLLVTEVFLPAIARLDAWRESEN
jgi:chorismate--pyruvate lyase